MKKKFLLAIIPALMAMSSCTYMQAGTKVQMNPNFLKEDTLAHEELFNGSELKLLNYNENSELPLRAPEDIEDAPVIGVQYAESTKNYKGEDRPVISFRYVAVIKSRHVKAEWSRAVSSQSGDTLKPKAIKESTVAYSAINNGSEYITAESMGGSCFVVYTLYDIPLFEYNETGVVNCNWSYIAASLKISDLDDLSKSTTSNVVAVEIGNRNHFSFHEDDLLDERGYFAAGIINGLGTAAEQVVVPLPEDGSNNHAKLTTSLKAGDRFGIFKWSETEFKFLGSFNRRDDSYFTKQSETISSNYAQIANNGTYTLTVDNDDRYDFSASSMTVLLCLDTTDYWGNGSGERFAIYYEAETWTWANLTAVNPVEGKSSFYTISLDVIVHPVFILCRMNKSEDNGWNSEGHQRVYNQTQNITFRSSVGALGTSAFNNRFKINGWDNDGGQSGYVRSNYSAA